VAASSSCRSCSACTSWTCPAVGSWSRSAAPSRARASSSTSTASPRQGRRQRGLDPGGRPALPHPAGEIETFTQETLAGSLRSIVGSLTVEQIIRDRAAFAQRVADESETSLTGQGLVLDTFQIQDITDDGTYLSDLGRPEAARVGQTAAIAEANARQAAEQARLAAEQEIAVATASWPSSRPRSRRRPMRRPPQARRRAPGPGRPRPGDPHRAGEGRRAQAALTERQLDTEVRRPADAERYKVEQEAEGPHRSHRRGRGPQGGSDRRRPGRRREGPAHR
jgi:hypothetical protein